MSRIAVQYGGKFNAASLIGAVRWLDDSTGICYMEEVGADLAWTFHDRTSAGHWNENGRFCTPIEVAPSIVPQGDPDTAFKSDGGKVRFELLEDGCPNALLLVAKVMDWAVTVKGYHAHSWREVPEASRRYRAALARHRNAIARGEVLDPESGFPHWAHIACCTLFLLELEIKHD